MIRAVIERLRSSHFPIYLAGNVASAMLGLVLLVVVSRALGPEGFGRVASLVNFLDIGVFLVDMAIFSGAVQLVAKYHGTDPARAQMALKVAFLARLALAGVFAVTGFLAAPAIARFLFDAEENVFDLRIIFLSVLAAAIYTQAISTLLARQNFTKLASATLLKNVTRLAFVILLLWLGLGAPGTIVVAYAVAATVAAMISLALCRFDFLSAPGIDRDVVREMFDINKWAIIAAVGMLGVRIDLIMLERLGAPSEVGLYAAAVQLLIVISLFSQSLANYLFPGLAGLTSADEMKAHVRRFARLIPIALLPIAVLLPASIWLAPLALGESYAGITGALSVMIISAALTLVLNPINLLFFPLGRVDILAKAGILMIVLRIALNFVLIPDFGALGAAGADLVAKIVVNGAMLVLLWRLLDRKDRAAEVAAA